MSIKLKTKFSLEVMRQVVRHKWDSKNFVLTLITTDIIKNIYKNS